MKSHAEAQRRRVYCSLPLRASAPPREAYFVRRGSATLWLVIWLPCLMAMFCALVGVANLWLARMELENAMEAAALAAVKSWGDAGGGDTLAPRHVGVGYAHADSVRRNPVVISDNYNAASAPNQNAQATVGMTPPTGNLVFGAIDDSDPNNITFNAGIAPTCGSPNKRYGVRAQAIVPLPSLGFGSFLGTISQYNVQAKATAMYDCASGRPKLVRIDTFIGPGP
jgi:Flp pilus assembly protein TadG